MIINPKYAIEGRSILSAKTRIKTMIDFLEIMPDSKVVVALQSERTCIESLTMVGDWFLAESVSFRDGDGFTNTFFTRNASEIATRIRTFEEELDDLLAQKRWEPENSRQKAVEELKHIIGLLEDMEKTKPANYVISVEELDGFLKF